VKCSKDKQETTLTLLPKNWHMSGFLLEQKNEFDAKYVKRKVKIGNGSFGTVYLGSLKPNESEQVAIKVVCKCRDDDDDMPEKLAAAFIDGALKEVAIWSKVKASPFILDLIDCFVIKNNAGGNKKNHPARSLYIITPFVPCDLEQYIVKEYFNAGLPVKTVCVVAIQLLLAGTFFLLLSTSFCTVVVCARLLPFLL
jgi:serine/threonine protein kinase